MVIVVQDEVRERERGRWQVYFCLFTGCTSPGWGHSPINPLSPWQSSKLWCREGRQGSGVLTAPIVKGQAGLEGIVCFSRSKIWSPPCPPSGRMTSLTSVLHPYPGEAVGLTQSTQDQTVIRATWKRGQVRQDVVGTAIVGLPGIPLHPSLDSSPQCLSILPYHPNHHNTH